MHSKPISRRTLLRTAGAVSIGLPLIEEMLISSASAAGKPTEVPVRAFNVFFGLGIPTPLQAEGFDGVLEPLKPLSDKLLIMRNVDQVRCDGKGNAHYDGAIGSFTAQPPDGEAKAGGPSIDQVIRKERYPNGLPSGMVSTLIGGTFFRRSRVGRYVHSYNHDGSVAATIQEKPRDVFNRVFGSVSFDDQDPSARRQRLKRSVLDSVVDEYRFYTGTRSPLGAPSKVRIADHLDRIREFEQRAFAMNHKNPNAPQLPPRSGVPHGGPADPGGQGIDLSLEELTTEWRLTADLFALAIQMDRVRFGAITFLAAGERIRLQGDYEYNGRKIWHFDDAKQLNASGDKGCSHEWWHQFNEKKKNEALRAHAHMKMREVAYFLGRLCDSESIEANGKSILENSLITISTESGDGRHSNVKRELSGVFHAITGANGRFKTGQIMDVNAQGIDVYNTMLAGMDVQGRLGPQTHKSHAVDAIRV